MGNNYEKLFSEKEKAKAFDQIAKAYYFKNFGTMQKSDLDVLMFSIYIEQILSKSESDFDSYSDYTLSKELGITQTRVNILKQKKELKYPKKGFDWRESFKKFVDKAIYDNNKIQIYVPDPNVYLEIKNVIEKGGGIVDVKRNKNVLQISPVDFIQLVVDMSDEGDEKKIQKECIEHFREDAKEKRKIEDDINRMGVGEALASYAKNKGIEAVIDIVSGFVTRGASGVIREIFEKFEDLVKYSKGGE